MTLIQKGFSYFRLGCCLLALAAVLPDLISLPINEVGEQLLAAPVDRQFAGKPAGNLHQLLARLEADPAKFVSGIYAPGIFALPIIEQPADNDIYVSVKRNLVTLFGDAAENGVTGLLAHNFLAGALFYNLEIGGELWLVDGEEETTGYTVTNIEQFQKIDGGEADTYINLRTQESMSTSEVFDRFYTGEPHLVLQTCLEEDDDPSWGLTFIVAQPIIVTSD
jgi:hypothetical protein